MIENEQKILGHNDEIKDRNGKVHKVYSCKLKYLPMLRNFTTKYNPLYLQIQALDFWTDEKGEVKQDKEGNPLFQYDNPEFMDGLYEVVELALDFKETREEIQEWIDFDLLIEIIQKLLGISQLKKNQI